MHFEEKTTKSERIYDGKVLNLRIDTVELPNMTYGHREIVERDSSVCVIPFKDEETVYMVKQYRKAIDKLSLEFPAGLVKEDEDPKQAAQRELQEEIGFMAEKLEYISEVYPSPGYTSEKIDIFIGKDLKESELDQDKEENIEIIEVKIKDLVSMVETFELRDSKTVIGALYISMKGYGHGDF